VLQAVSGCQGKIVDFCWKLEEEEKKEEIHNINLQIWALSYLVELGNP